LILYDVDNFPEWISVQGLFLGVVRIIGLAFKKHSEFVAFFLM